jgi:hypothetical protein
MFSRPIANIAKIMIKNFISNSIQSLLGINSYNKNQFIVYMTLHQIGFSIKTISLIIMFL